MPVFNASRLTCLAAILVAACGANNDVSAQSPVTHPGTQDAAASERLVWGRLADPLGADGRVIEVRMSIGEEDDHPVLGRFDHAPELVIESTALEQSPREDAASVGEVFAYWGDCPAGSVVMVNADVLADEIVLFADDPKTSFGSGIVAASAPSMADWVVRGMEPEIGSSFLEFYLSNGEAEAKGVCDLGEDLTVEYDVQIRPGLNIVRVEYVSFLPAGDGTLGQVRQRMISEDTFPEDIQWTVYANSH